LGRDLFGADWILGAHGGRHLQAGSHFCTFLLWTDDRRDVAREMTGIGTDETPMRTAVVLSAGGLRGAAHVGVLRQLVRQGVRIDAIVGVSAGAVIAAYYAAVGLDLDELIADAARFRGRHLLTYSLNVHLA